MEVIRTAMPVATQDSKGLMSNNGFFKETQSKILLITIILLVLVLILIQLISEMVILLVFYLLFMERGIPLMWIFQLELENLQLKLFAQRENF